MDWLHRFLQLLLSLFCLAALSSPLGRRDSAFTIANLSARALPLSHRVEYVIGPYAVCLVLQHPLTLPSNPPAPPSDSSPARRHCRYFFLVTPDSAAADAAQCSALVTGLNELMSSVPPTACEGGGLSFEWRQLDEDGAELRVMRNLSSSSPPAPPLIEAGGHRIGRDEIAVLAAGTQFQHQAYVGPTNFSMPITGLVGMD